MITYADFVDWLAHPATCFFMQKLDEMREDIKEQLADGNLTESTVEATAIKHAEAIGKCVLLKDLMDISPADVDLREAEDPKQ